MPSTLPAFADQTLQLALCGFHLELSARAFDRPIGVRGAMSCFLLPPGTRNPPHLRLELGWERSDRGEEETLFEAGSSWKLTRSGDQLCFYFYASHSPTLPYKRAELSPDLREGKIILEPAFFREPVLYPLDYPCDELLLIHLLGRWGGVELHASAALDPRGRGHLFAGQSGAGKTTLARLLKKSGYRVLNDDRVVVRPIGGRFQLFGTPWHGEGRLFLPGSAPLARIYLLSHGRRNRLKGVKPSRAVAGLLARSFLPFYCPRQVEATLGFLEELCRRVPCREFSFRPDPSAVACLEGEWAAPA